MKSATATAFMIAALAVSAILPYFITNLGYFASDPEVIIICVAAAAVGALLGWLAHGRVRLLAAILAFATYWIADAYFANSLATIPIAAVAGLAVYIGMTTKFAPNLSAMLTVFALFWTISNAFTAPPALLTLDPVAEDTRTQTSDGPPIVHFIFDELMSPSAVAMGFPGLDHPASRLVPDLAARGFEVHTNARSIAPMTRISLSSIFGLANTQDNWKLGAGRYSLEMHNNAYVRDLHQRGYKITLHQSSYIALCTGLPGERCFTHSRAGNAHAYAAITDDLWLRTRYALIEMDNQLSSLSASGTVAVYALAKQLAIRLGIQVEPPDYYSTPAAMMVVLEDVEAKLKEMKRGEAYIVHVLLPHAPYTLDTDCKVKPPGQWSRGTRPDRPVTMTDAEIYSGYWDQVGCMGRRLNTLVDIILATEAGKDATILVHGDHGARVTLERAAGENQDDLVQTLFAVRTPTLKGAVIAEPKVLQDLFLETYRRQFP